MNAVDDASETSEDESVIILTQIHNYSEEYVLTQKAARKTINSDLVLLDSRSTVNLFTNPEHVRNIRPATTPIKVQCNKGTLTTNEEVNFGNTPVYFDDHGIANVLSLYRLGRKFKVTVIGHGIGRKYIPIMAHLAETRRWSKRRQTCLSSPDLTAIHNE